VFGDGSAPPSVQKFAVDMKRLFLQVNMVLKCGYALRYMMRFHRKARNERKAVASFDYVFMRRKWISHLRLSAFICGSIFPKQFIDTEISAQIIK